MSEYRGKFLTFYLLGRVRYAMLPYNFVVLIDFPVFITPLHMHAIYHCTGCAISRETVIITIAQGTKIKPLLQHTPGT